MRFAILLPLAEGWRRTTLDKLTHHDFKMHHDDTFRLDIGNGQTVDLKLTEVEVFEKTSWRAPDSPDGRSPFSLTFVGQAELVLPQRIYRIDHETMDTLELFIVPIGQNADGVSYQAVFS